MKFLCDRCKTRYSIGDDRVRGKILKIRCKNCANVITVREGMTADEEDRRSRPTTAAPMSTVGQPMAANGALASAFAQQLAKPPPALEEEWYVSIDGVQSGPFGLADAQRWVTNKAIDADLHCWSEGFDDWLPVDKVSHFRGLRKKLSTPTVPPPTPAVRPRQEDDAKPLFAATMATLERAGTAPPPMGMPAINPAIPANGRATKANGTGPAARLPDPRDARDSRPSKPTGGLTGPNLPSNGSGAGSKMSPGQAALASAFDVADAKPDSAAPEPQPFKGMVPRAPVVATPLEPDPNDSNLDIGEVSRVVNLADLARSANAQRAPRPRANVGRTTGAAPKFDPAALVDDPAAARAEAATEGLTAAPVVAQAHRRGLIMLIGAAAVLLASVAVLLVLVLNKGDTEDLGGLGPAHTIDTSRPEEIVRAHLAQTASEGSGAPVRQHHTTGFRTNPTGAMNPANPGTETPDVPGNRLKAEEIEDMAQKNSTGTQRCYMRAQRGAEGIEIGDLKKISVTLSVDKTGAVSEVLLSDHATDTLGICLAGQIKRWKFRESSGGQFRIVLAFAN